MKKAEEYLYELCPLFVNSSVSESLYAGSGILSLLKQAQIDAYNQAIRDASIKCDDPCLDYLSSKLIKQLILNLKKN